MKKKQKTKTTAVAALLPAASDLEPIIHSHSEFFDRLVEFIPARFYLTNDDDPKPWYQGLSRAAKASLKHQSKQNLKLARRNRFDPDGEPSSAAQHKQSSKATLPGGDSAEEEESRPNPIDAEEKSVTYEQLREKLRRKIELLRGNRGEKKPYEKRVRSFDGNKRKRDGEEGEKGDESDEEIIEYGKVKLGDEEEGGTHFKKKSKKSVSKAKEFEIAKKKQEARKENPTVAERESWSAAASRAMGVKVHDDPRLIKQSMAKEKKRKEKNAEKWKERLESQGKLKDERQKKRSENIAGRINEKKNRKIAKREKKLMSPGLRAGFEGRKEGFITKE